MYIQPNTTIKILHNIPLDPTYEHTVFFTDRQTQYETFAAKAKYTLNAQTYQRVEKNKMRIQIKAENLYDCNYLMFRNTAFDTDHNYERWFYAFITNVEYINNLVSEVTYELDVMQTWFFDYDLRECFVEREHSATDVGGENTLPEPVPLGDYVYIEDVRLANLFSDYAICIATSQAPPDGEGTQWQSAEGGIYCGVYSGVHYYVFTSATNANQFLMQATDDNKSDAIISVFMIPSIIYGAADPTVPASANAPISRITNFEVQHMPGVPYTPRNKKLLTYPYAFYTIMDTDGNKTELRQEYFANRDQMLLNVKAAINTTPEYGVFPLNYKDSSDYNFVEGIITSGAPQCAYSIDSYRAWIAQRRYPMIMASAMAMGQMASGAVEAILDFGAKQSYANYRPNTMALSTEVLPADVGPKNESLRGLAKYKAGATAVAGILTACKQAETLPAITHGCASNVLTMGMYQYGFHAYQTTIRSEYAQIIDEYFDRYGYACLRNKIPNRDVRNRYCYTKTANCTIAGNMPADDEETICSIYNAGITFWKNIDQIGVYNGLPNRPTHEG